MNLSVPAQSPNLQTPDVYVETEYNPTCNMFTTIHDHLEHNYHALALDTLDFPIAESVASYTADRPRFVTHGMESFPAQM